MAKDLLDSLYKKALKREMNTGTKQRYIVDNSSIFDSMKYDASAIRTAVRKSGGSNVRMANNNGWSNQPKVVTFNATEPQLEKIRGEIAKSLGGLARVWGVRIRKKDW